MSRLDPNERFLPPRRHEKPGRAHLPHGDPTLPLALGLVCAAAMAVFFVETKAAGQAEEWEALLPAVAAGALSPGVSPWGGAVVLRDGTVAAHAVPPSVCRRILAAQEPPNAEIASVNGAAPPAADVRAAARDCAEAQGAACGDGRAALDRACEPEANTIEWRRITPGGGR